MRTAILISGKPVGSMDGKPLGGVAECWESWSHLTKHFPNPDYFIHTSEQFVVPDEFFGTLKPKYSVEKQEQYPEIEKLLEDINYHSPHHQNSYIQQMYGWKRVWKMKEETGINYDLVVRLRPDVFFIREFPLPIYDLERITAVSCEFSTGPNHLMKHYFGMFDWLNGDGQTILRQKKDFMHKKFDACHSETILAMYITFVLELPSVELKKTPEYNSIYDFYRISHLHHYGTYGPIKP